MCYSRRNPSQILTNVTWNVNSLRKRSKINKVYAALRALGFPDVVCFQETHSDVFHYTRYKTRFCQYYVYAAHGNSRSRGVVILIKKTLDFLVNQSFIDAEGRYIILKGTLNNTVFNIACLYAPFDTKANKEKFFNKIVEIDLGINHLILGDMNCVVLNKLDRLNVEKEDQVAPEQGDNVFLNFMDVTNSTDVWRALHPDLKQYSYARKRFKGPFSRLDYCLYTSNFIDQVILSTFVSDFRVSDHKMLYTRIKIGNKLIGHDFKKIRPHIFTTPQFKTQFSLIWQEMLNDLYQQLRVKVQCGEVDPSVLVEDPDSRFNISNPEIIKHLDINHLWWDTFQQKLTTIAFSIQKEEMNALNTENMDLLMELQSYVHSSIKYKKTEAKLIQNTSKLTKRSLQEDYFYEQMHHEKCTEFFMQLFKPNKKDLFVGDIPDDTGNILTSQLQKQNYLKQKFYELYNMDFPVSKDPDKTSKILNFAKHVPPLGDLDATDIGPITLDEVTYAIKGSSNNKCPGIDGIPAEFFKLYLSKIVPFLTALFNNIYDGGTVPSTWNTTIIKLIPKSKDVTYDKMRPLQLMVEISKIYARIFYNRLDPLLQKLINEYQSGGVRGRSLNSNVILIHLLITYYNIIGDDGFMFSIDNSKAFCRIYREYLFTVCRQYRLPEKMINTIENVYSNSRGKLLINGFFTDSFKISNGIRQGCPLSAALYVLAVEPLARYFQQCIYVQCMKLPNLCEVRCIQHIDDMTFFLQNEKSIRYTLAIIDQFNYVCGSALNLDKCGVVRLNYDGPKYKVQGITILDRHSFHRILGILFSSYSEEYIIENWDKLIADITKDINKWNCTDMTPIGRTLIANLKLFSKISFKSNIIGIPNTQLETINKLIFDFVDNRHKKIPFNVLTLPKSSGGMGLIDIKQKATALRLPIVQNLLQTANSILPVVSSGTPANGIKMATVSNSINIILTYFFSIHLQRSFNIKLAKCCPQFGRYSLSELKESSVTLNQLYDDLATFNKLSENRDLLEVSSTTYYQILTDKQNTFCDFGRYLVDTEEVENIWDNIFLKHLDNKIIMLNYNIIYGRVKTAYHNYPNSLLGYPRKLLRCTWCFYCTTHLNILNQVETLEHIFLQCPVAFQTWDIIRARLISAGLSIYGHTVENGSLKLDPIKILYKIPPVSRSEAYFINVVNDALYDNRCKNYNMNHTEITHFEGANDVIHNLLSKLQMFSSMQRKFMSKNAYQAAWGTLNATCEAISGNNFCPTELEHLKLLNSNNYRNYVYYIWSQDKDLSEIFID